MRALVVRQPFASQIASGVKTIEVRSWATRHRGPLLVCAGAAFSALPEARGLPDGPRGVALCVVDVVDVRPGQPEDVAATGGVSAEDRIAWVLAAPRRVEPLRVRGMPGIFAVADHMIRPAGEGGPT